MARLARQSPIPIALDEELIACPSFEDKKRLLEAIHPSYLVIKPTLHGGIRGGEEWIELASKYGINWWITSALESNIGLNAIAQWCATCQIPCITGWEQACSTPTMCRRPSICRESIYGSILPKTPSTP
jgi:L-alanine-DL-glutamate epimerase-like enolase superfamily enzyme